MYNWAPVNISLLGWYFVIRTIIQLDYYIAQFLSQWESKTSYLNSETDKLDLFTRFEMPEKAIKMKITSEHTSSLTQLWLELCTEYCFDKQSPNLNVCIICLPTAGCPLDTTDGPDSTYINMFMYYTLKSVLTIAWA